MEWKRMGSPVGGGIDGRVTSFTIYNNELYVGGWYSSASGIKADNIAKWNGATWSSVGEGLPDEVYTLAVYKGALYAGGWFNKHMVQDFQADHIAKWDGIRWETVVNDISGNLSGGTWIMSFAVFENDLYAVGNFETCNGFQANCIAKWNDTTWASVGTGIKPNRIYRAIEFNNELNVAGIFDTAGSVRTQYFAYWDGKNWQASKFMLDSSPYCLYTDNDNLYVGGMFNIANSIEVNGIFRWDGEKVYALGKGVQGSVSSILVIRN